MAEEHLFFDILKFFLFEVIKNEMISEGFHDKVGLNRILGGGD